MKIGECHKCGEPIYECTNWDISMEQGFTCEKCNYKNRLTDDEYYANAAWLKSLENK